MSLAEEPPSALPPACVGDVHFEDQTSRVDPYPTYPSLREIGELQGPRVPEKFRRPGAHVLLAGTPLRAGAEVAVFLGSANRPRRPGLVLRGVSALPVDF